jgi:hypothetical protein
MSVPQPGANSQNRQAMAGTAELDEAIEASDTALVNDTCGQVSPSETASA